MQKQLEGTQKYINDSANALPISLDAHAIIVSNAHLPSGV